MSGEKDTRKNGESVKGVIASTLPNNLFSVDVDGRGLVTAHVSAEMRMCCVRLLKGECVSLTLSPYDPTRGRITGRI